jgi:hypothetical protein
MGLEHASQDEVLAHTRPGNGLHVRSKHL